MKRLICIFLLLLTSAALRAQQSVTADSLYTYGQALNAVNFMSMDGTHLRAAEQQKFGMADTDDLLEADVQQLQSKINLAISKANTVEKYYDLLLVNGQIATK